MTKPDIHLSKGDRVRCLNGDAFGLKADELYTVEAHHSWIGETQLVYIDGISDVVPLNANRFELVEPAEISKGLSPKLREQAKRDHAVAETLAIAGIDPAPPKTVAFGHIEGFPMEGPEVSFEKPAPADPRMTRADMVNLPQHYARFAIEPIRFICENSLDFMRGNAVKYILRCDAKNGREDLAKARRYLDMFERFHFDRDPDWWRIGQGAGA